MPIIYWLPWIFVLISAILVHFIPITFPVLFAVNIWGLSMPHTFSTFTRGDLRRPKVSAIAFILFLILAGIIYTASFKFGFVLVYSFYFYWQQFHYTKQNMGIGVWDQKDRSKKERVIDETFFFLVTIISILGIFHGENIQFFAYQLINPIKLSLNSNLAIAINTILFLIYIYLRPKNIKMAFTHTLIFTFSYLMINNFAIGWLLLNILHNSQYLIFMHQKEKNFLFVIYAVIFSLIFYGVIELSAKSGNLFFIPITISIVLMLALNFTHYLFDAFIWKKKITHALKS